MDLEAIKFLADLMEEKGLTSLDVHDGDHVISLQRQAAPLPPFEYAPPAAPAIVPQQEPEQESGENVGDVVNFNHVTELKSPMVGTVYVSPSPGAEPYVKIGDKVKKGQVLCLIEAMKLMNEYTAPQDGEIVDINIHDGDLVEYGQCLFTIY